MSNIRAMRDENSVPSLLAVSSADGVSLVEVWADPATHRLLVQLIGGGGSVWYQDEVLSSPSSPNPGTSFTLAHDPSLVVLLYLNGQYQVSGIDYTRSGTSITMASSVLSTDTLVATYS